MATTLTGATSAVLERAALAAQSGAAPDEADREPVPVAPGSLGAWRDDEVQ
jgi:hypothetical protein